MAVAESADRSTDAPAALAGPQDYRCSECGYGAVLAGDLPPCPMCQTDSWVAIARAEQRRPPHDAAD